MRLRNLLFIGALALSSSQANAQAWVKDSVEMGVNYANDIFYSMKNGQVKSQDATDWHLAFQMTQFGEPFFNASVRANHIKGKVEVYSLHMKASTNFTTMTASDTIGKTAATMQLINIDSTWGEGAFIQNRDVTDLFDYGWGKYQGPPNHNLLGDSIYLVKVNNVAYKLWLKEYISIPSQNPIGYKFRIAALDNSSDDSFYVQKQNYANRLYAYFNVTTKTFSDREPDRTTWDLLFTQYPKYLVFGPSGLQAYTGVLTNQSVQITELTTDPNNITSANYSSSLGNMSKYINVIGDDWKTFNMTTFMYQTDTMKSWIIKKQDANGEINYYQLRFTRFDGASGGATGKIIFDKRNLAQILSVDEVVNNISRYAIYPNPSDNNVTIIIDAKDNAGDGYITIADLSGKIVSNMNVKINRGVNAMNVSTSSLAPGIYTVRVGNGTWKATEKLVVQH